MNPLAQEDRIQTPVLELNRIELEIVVAGEGGHCVGRGPPSCLVCATYTLARLHIRLLDNGNLAEVLWKEFNDVEQRSTLSTFDCCIYQS